jgi:hypothetical protein
MNRRPAGFSRFPVEEDLIAEIRRASSYEMNRHAGYKAIERLKACTSRLKPTEDNKCFARIWENA